MVAIAAYMPQLLLVTRIAITLALATFQFIFFGKPALERFSSAAVGESMLIEKGDGLRPPAITLCPYKHNYNGWRQATKQDYVEGQHYNRWCASAKSTGDFEKCIKEETFALNETVIEALKGWTGNKSITGPEFWTSHVTESFSGRCYTLNLDLKLGINTSTEAIILNLNQNLTYTIFFHQPEFYRFPFNSAAMPSVIRTISPQQIGNKLSSFFLELVRRERLNRAENRCNPDADYKFTRCIKQSFIDVIGCKLPWDKHTKGSAIKKIPKHLKNI